MEQKNDLNLLRRSLYWTSGLYALTALHHYYGSVVYGTPWRAHVVLLGGIALLLCLVLSGLYRRFRKALWLYGYLLIATVLFGFGIGLFEGLYNHVLKNLLYFGGMNKDAWRSLFPAPTYELPENFVFETTGILQFAVGAAQLYSLYRFYWNFKKYKS